MCYHVSTAPKDEFNAYVQDMQVESYAHYHYTNGFDHQHIPITSIAEPNKVYNGVWGLVREDVPGPQARDYADTSLNARNDRLFVSKFAEYTNNRCLVWVNGFYEWMHIEYQVPGKGKRMRTVKDKIPHYIYMKGHRPFSMGGIYSEWVNPTTGEVQSMVAIITTDANELLADIHNTKKRMPFIVPEDKRSTWLGELDRQQITDIMQPLPDGQLDAHTISKLITSRDEPRNQPAVQEPYTYTDIPNTLF